MAWYRRSSKPFFEVFRWKIGLPRKPIEEPFSRAFSSDPKFSTSYKISQSIFRVNYIGQWKRPHDAKRFYNAAPQHQSCTNAKVGKVFLFLTVSFLTWVIVTLTYGVHCPCKTTPYTLRRQSVCISEDEEKEIGGIQIEQIKKQFKGKIVDPLHPDSIKVQSILHYIIEALQRGFSYDNNSPEDPIMTSRGMGLLPEDVKNGGYNVKNDLVEDKWDNEDLVLDYKWVQYRRKIGRYHSHKSSSGHVDSLLMGKKKASKMFEWEVVVVDEPDVVDAFCLPGGKIVVFTGLLKHFGTPSEIAAIIGHQVGHAVSRHHAKQVSRENDQWLIIKRIFSSDIVKTLPDLFVIRHPFSPREEMEADSIGLLLAACAGYDPRVAPRVYEKLATFGGDYDTTHSSGKKRAQLLAQAKVMQNAIYIFQLGKANKFKVFLTVLAYIGEMQKVIL